MMGKMQRERPTRISRSYTILMVLLLGVALSACGRNPASGYGFALPEGDVESGERVFIAFKCTACHTISGRPDITHEGGRELSIALGGPVSRVATYGELVSSIINPSHRIAKEFRGNGANEATVSPMRNYNSVLTVDELIDLTAFLQSQYSLEWSDQSQYPDFFYP